MSQQALIRGEVNFRAGDGMLMPIPNGPVDIEVSDDSVTLGWIDGPNPGSAAIPLDEFQRYLAKARSARSTDGSRHDAGTRPLRDASPE
jgi:hypothetical protein